MEQDETAFLKTYDAHKYDKPSVTVDILIFALRDMGKDAEKKRRLSILLIKRKKHPYKDSWAIPGGFVNMDETLDDAAYRELQEETSVTNVSLEQLYTFGNVHRDPRMRVISVAYLAFSKELDIEVTAGDDAKEAKWFFLELDTSMILLKSEDGMEEMRYKICDGNFISIGTNEFAFDHQEIFYMGLKRFITNIEKDDEISAMLKNFYTSAELDAFKDIR